MSQFNQFVESLKRLYQAEKINANKIVELFESGKINDEEKWHILNARKGL